MTEIKAIRINRTIEYHPESYLSYCKDSGEIPSQDGFLEYNREFIDEDFQSAYYEQVITEVP